MKFSLIFLGLFINEKVIICFRNDCLLDSSTNNCISSSCSSSSTSFYECYEDSCCVKPRRKCFRPRDRRGGNILLCSNECVQSLKQAEFILRSLYCVSSKITKLLFESLSSDIKDLYSGTRETLISKFVANTNDLERSILLIIGNAFKNIDTATKAIVGAKDENLKKQIDFNTTVLLSAYTAYATPLIAGLANPDDVPAIIAGLKSSSTGAVATLTNLLKTFDASNNLAIEKTNGEIKTLVNVGIQNELADAITAIMKAFKTYLADGNASVIAGLGIVSGNLANLVIKTEKALMCALESNLVGNFRIVEFLIRRCLEVVTPGCYDQYGVCPLFPAAPLPLFPGTFI